jgi:hypothetical protein
MVMILCELFVKEIERDNSDMADAMRALFDNTCHLHQYYFQEKDDSMTGDLVKSAASLSDEEKDWRDALAVGSKLDVIRIDWEYNIKIWTRGVVK